MLKYRLYTAKERPELITAGDEIVMANWPLFMLQDKVANEYFFKLYDAYPDLQYWLIDEDNHEIIGIGNSAPINFSGELDDLPEKGWDWALKKCFNDIENNVEPNILCAMSITLNPEYKGKGIGYKMVEAMMVLGRKQNFKQLILPVRPSEKHKYPLISMDEYISNWKRENGYSTDQWIRVHQKLGGKIIRPCNEAMYIDGSINEWQEWTGMEFHISGKYVVPFALKTVNINIEKDLGSYTEPNVWMVHKLGEIK